MIRRPTSRLRGGDGGAVGGGAAGGDGPALPAPRKGAPGNAAVVRLNAATWRRVAALMERHGKTAGEVLAMGLDALAAFDGPAVVEAEVPAVRGRWAGRPVVAQRAFRLPLLEVLWRLGGRGEAGTVRLELEKALAGVLGEGDRRAMASGQPRWWNAVCWERAALVREGLLASGGRGVWVLTEKGRAAYLGRG